MSRCTVVLLLAGMVALCVSTATPAWEVPGAEELALSSLAAKLKGCVKKVDSSKLTAAEKKVLRSCARPALTGSPQTEKAVADRYVACVERRSVSQAAKDEAKKVANCMTAAPTPAWEVPAAADPQDLVDELQDTDAEELAFIGSGAKLRRCVRQVDKSKLKEDEKKVLQACIRPALVGLPYTPQAIAERYLKCVVSKSVSEVAKDVAKQVANCMTSASTPAGEVPAADPQDLEEDLVDTDAEELAFIGSGAKLRRCVRQVDKSKLKEDEKKVLHACIRPALVGRPCTPQAIAERYLKCVVSQCVSEVAKDAAKQVANCMRYASTPAWEVLAVDPQDLEEDFAYIGLGGKLRECVRRVDKSKLKEEEKKVLQSCIRSALLGIPYNARAIAERYAKCVQSKNVSQAALDAAKQVVNCMSMRM